MGICSRVEKEWNTGSSGSSFFFEAPSPAMNNWIIVCVFLLYLLYLGIRIPLSLFPFPQTSVRFLDRQLFSLNEMVCQSSFICISLMTGM